MRFKIKYLGSALLIFLVLSIFLIVASEDSEDFEDYSDEFLNVEVKGKGMEMFESIYPMQNEFIFSERDSILSIEGNEFTNINPEFLVTSEVLSRSEIRVDRDGNIIKAQFKVNEKGGSYKIEDAEFSVPPNTQVEYEKNEKLKRRLLIKFKVNEKGGSFEIEGKGFDAPPNSDVYYVKETDLDGEIRSKHVIIWIPKGGEIKKFPLSDEKSDIRISIMGENIKLPGGNILNKGILNFVNNKISLHHGYWMDYYDLLKDKYPDKKNPVSDWMELGGYDGADSYEITINGVKSKFGGDAKNVPIYFSDDDLNEGTFIQFGKRKLSVKLLGGSNFDFEESNPYINIEKSDHVAIFLERSSSKEDLINGFDLEQRAENPVPLLKISGDFKIEDDSMILSDDSFKPLLHDKGTSSPLEVQMYDRDGTPILFSKEEDMEKKEGYSLIFNNQEGFYVVKKNSDKIYSEKIKRLRLNYVTESEMEKITGSEISFSEDIEKNEHLVVLRRIRDYWKVLVDDYKKFDGSIYKYKAPQLNDATYWVETDVKGITLNIKIMRWRGITEKEVCSLKIGKETIDRLNSLKDRRKGRR